MQISGISAVILVIFIFFAVQSVGGYLQIKRYQEAVKRVHKLGNVGIGQRRGSLLNAHVAIIACDKEGIITGAEVLDGISVWADFHPVDTFLGKKLVGTSIFEFLEMTEGFSKKEFKKYQGYIRALEALEVRLTDRELTREQEKYMDKKFGKDRKKGKSGL